MKKLTLAFVLLLNVSCFANTLQIGQKILPFELRNQHGKMVKVDDKAKIILFTKEKAPSNLLNRFLLKQNGDFLSKNHAYFIADISAMPFLISKMIAIPQLKKMSHEILLVKKETTLSFVPHKKGFITVIKKKDGKIQAISFVNTMTAVEKIFK